MVAWGCPGGPTVPRESYNPIGLIDWKATRTTRLARRDFHGSSAALAARIKRFAGPESAAPVMQHLIRGIHRFQNEDFRELHDLFEELAHGQKPETLFITCSDSRIDPNMMTQSLPGDLFILRNAGNIVPPHGAGPASGESATIEFAVTGLGVKDIIVCGHTH